MKGMILAAGYGERLWPLTADRTKPALPVLGKPLVGYVAEYLARFGFTDIVVNLHHYPDSVRRSLGDGSRFGVSLEYVHEPIILGTSGAIDNARQLLRDDTFVVINGKLITDIDLNAALAVHRERKALATLVLRENPRLERFSIVEVHDGLVKRFSGMPPVDPAGVTTAPLMFTGIQILEPRIFDYIPRQVFSHSTVEVYPQAIAKGEPVVAHVADGMWYELSTLQRYLEISLVLMQKEGRDVHAGAGAYIDPGADVRESILWDGVTIEKGAYVRRAILGDNVCIPSAGRIENAVVVRREFLEGKKTPAKALKGHPDGDNFVVPLSQ